MKLQIKSERNNPFLKRKEIDLMIDHEGQATPTREQLREEAAKLLNVSKEYIEVRRIMSVKGAAKSVARIYVHEEPIAEEKKEKTEAKPEETPEAETPKTEGEQGSGEKS